MFDQNKEVSEMKINNKLHETDYDSKKDCLPGSLFYNSLYELF